MVRHAIYDSRRHVQGIREKLSRFPGSVIKLAIVNQDLVENHFSQLWSGSRITPSYSFVTNSMQYRHIQQHSITPTDRCHRVKFI